MRLVAAVALIAAALSAQVYSPSVLREGQPDATNLKSFVEGIYHNARANSPRERAEAIWRFFLTDGRFVKPGFWYHIAGWAYEEPTGEVLDPLKLLNSYGFGLCYHIAPLLEAVFEAGGFEDARVWFLTGHTVAEVYYDGAYHYFDSDMLGYNVAGDDFRSGPVASVRQLEQNPRIILDKMAGPKTVRPGVTDDPWYPADVRAAAMEGLASLFTSTEDNYLFPYTRHSTGHDMSYVLRPGEKLIRYFQPEEPGLFYLPYAFDGRRWSEFPKEIARYRIRTSNGPRSQKDDRTWGTGRIEYNPPVTTPTRIMQFDMPSPWVIIDARFVAALKLPDAASGIRIETSVDGRVWHTAGELTGPYDGSWTAEPKVIARTPNGRWTAVSGTYGYKVRITPRGKVQFGSLTLTSRIQLNPRTLPAIEPGENRLVYRAGPETVRTALPLDLQHMATRGLRLVTESGQAMLCPESEGPGEALLELDGAGAFDAGARFLDLRESGLAPDKLTAETRPTSVKTRPGKATIAWSASAEGPWRTEWTFPAPRWRDKDSIDRVLQWPEAFVQVRKLPAGSKKVWVRLRTEGPCIDNVRAAGYAPGKPPGGKLKVTHQWTENGSPRQHVEIIPATERHRPYVVRAGAGVVNQALIFESIP